MNQGNINEQCRPCTDSELLLVISGDTSMVSDDLHSFANRDLLDAQLYLLAANPVHPNPDDVKEYYQDIVEQSRNLTTDKQLANINEVGCANHSQIYYCSQV